MWTAGKTSRSADRKIPWATSSDQEAPSATLYRPSGPTSALRPWTCTLISWVAPGLANAADVEDRRGVGGGLGAHLVPSTHSVAWWLIAPKFSRVT